MIDIISLGLSVVSLLLFVALATASKGGERRAWIAGSVWVAVAVIDSIKEVL